ncbi:glycerophosphodiester phosphodiesterase family protein [Planococcus sp. ISL-109]|uniref:glycerophosphodiester phosphodiesterase family protein n=1 Tax=Planococcus sp. ISL-109 TaxID=2819166 RepID=UPI001BEC689F|nr:glycerophosphodiester phosphodiesterase family protein [Planococcus sp. ISL-109]MBT2583079.1 glycerophosphodiester phosphodiesterase [Planococcus sp. ISL-109]
MKIFAHRGSSGTHPENTLPAFQKAAALPIFGVELDVHLSKDGELVVIHDEKVNRTTDGQGYVKDLALAEVKELDAGSWKDEKWSGVNIPTLEEVFGVFEETGHVLNIELKTDVFPYDGAVKKVVDLAAAWDMKSRIVISSFNHPDVQQALHTCHVPGAILASNILVGMAEYAKTVGTNRLHLSLPYALRHGAELIGKGCEVYVYTVNRLDYAEQLQAIGVHGIFTDFPEKMYGELI